ncbi:MAG: DNA polymerase [Verrucomicrobia bacterium]|nr:MAG: DNA polymerase [Verrucomicrobiota bacterium]
MADEPTVLHPLPALLTLAAFMEGRQRAGQQRIWMSEPARQALKEMIRMKPGRMEVRPVVVASVVEPKEEPKEEIVLERVETVPVVMVPKVETVVETVVEREEPMVSVMVVERTREEREVALAAVKARAEIGERARGLGTLRDTMVFAVGNPDSPLMLVGEAPGAEEEKQGEPFVGPAGQLLDKMLVAMGLDRGGVYISNLCKFRPAISGGAQGSGNRAPTAEEMAACVEFVREEIAIIRPRVIVALGATASEGLLGRKVAITRERGQWQTFEGIPLMLTLHPSYLLRAAQEGPVRGNAEKRKVWEDLVAVMDRLGMLVSEKQRGFFRKVPRE